MAALFSVLEGLPRCLNLPLNWAEEDLVRVGKGLS